MSYGYDSPRRVQQRQRARRGRSLLRRCIAAIVIYAFIAAGGLIALQIREACGPTYRLDSGPHTTYATTRAHP